MLIVELFLNGFLHAKRCPLMLTPQGRTDYDAIRRHFAAHGYDVGEIRDVARIRGNSPTRH